MVFITGTDTGVGKTYFSCLLVKALREAGFDAVGFKPICCGDRNDAIALVQASEDALSVNECNPVWMRFPASPYTSSIIEERLINLDDIRQQWEKLKERFSTIVVEGVGGWSVPIHRDYFASDLAREFGLPVVMIAANRLGVINHVMLTKEAIQNSQTSCAGIILNNGVTTPDPVTLTNRSILDDLLRGTDTRILGEIDSESRRLSPTLFNQLRSLFTMKNFLPSGSPESIMPPCKPQNS